jgi:hypothetical protein
MNADYIIHLPSHLPARREYPHVPLTDVKSPIDLPPYLFMGRLDEDSFTITAAGWSAAWQRDAGTWFRLDYNAKSGAIEARENWLGVEGFFSHLGKPDWRVLAQMRYITPVKAWEERAEEILQARWNLKYLKAEDGDWIMAGLPDGLMKTLLLPLPVSSLPVLIEVLAGFRSDPTMDFPVSGYVCPVMGAINYIEGRNPPWAEEPNELWMKTFQATEFPPLDVPVREQGSDGTAAWTVRRYACMAFLGVPFVGLIPLLERLEEHGLIGAGPMHSVVTGPNITSVEFSGCILQVGKEFQFESVAWNSPDRQRRVFWKMPDDLMETFTAHAAHRDDDPEIARDQASQLVRQSREWVDAGLGDTHEHLL